MYIFLTIGGGAPSVFTPWLNIPKETYYSVNRFLVAPSLIMAWLLSAFVMQIHSPPSILSLCISVAMWGTLIHDLPMSILSALKVINANQHEIAMNSPTIWRTLLWATFAIYLSAFMILFSKCVRTVHKLSPYPQRL
jgi:hypothetical protein